MSIVNIAGESIFSPVKFLDNLIAWTLNKAGEVALELNLSQLQRHPDACDATLAPASYCEPILMVDTATLTNCESKMETGHLLVPIIWKTEFTYASAAMRVISVIEKAFFANKISIPNVQIRVPQNTYPVRTEHYQWTELKWAFSTITTINAVKGEIIFNTAVPCFAYCNSGLRDPHCSYRKYELLCLYSLLDLANHTEGILLSESVE